jgi:hypothetical protein
MIARAAPFVAPVFFVTAICALSGVQRSTLGRISNAA